MSDWSIPQSYRPLRSLHYPNLPVAPSMPSSRSMKIAGATLAASAIAGAAGYGYSKKYGGRRLKKKAKKRASAMKNKKRITYLSKKIGNNEATLDFRARSYRVTKTSGINTCIYDSIAGSNASLIESSITALDFFDPSDPGNLQVVNYNTGTFQKRIMVNAYGNISLRNNYKVPVRLKLWLCKVKADTNNSPENAISAGFADVGSAGLAVTDILTKAKDSQILKDLWNCKLMKNIIVQPSGVCYASHRGKQFSFDTSLRDTHNQSFVKQFYAYAWLVRLEGIAGHDTAEDEQGSLQCGLDIVVNRNHRIIYDAGSDLVDVQTSSDGATFQNNGVCTQLNEEQIDFGL